MGSESQIVRAMLFFLAVMIAGCDLGSSRQPLSCFPEDSGVGINNGVNESSPLRNAGRQPPEQVQIYLDGSGGIQGFLDGHSRDQTAHTNYVHYKTILRFLQDLPANLAAELPVKAFKFGKSIKPINFKTLENLALKKKFYNDKVDQFNDESRIDAVLSQVACIDHALASKCSTKEMAALRKTGVWIVGTDLVLEGDKDKGRNALLVPALSSLINAKQSIAVISFRAPYEHELYHARNYSHDGYLRYFFLVGGPEDRLNYVIDLIRSELADSIGAIDVNIYSPVPRLPELTARSLNEAGTLTVEGASFSNSKLVEIRNATHIEVTLPRASESFKVQFDIGEYVSKQNTFIPAVEPDSIEYKTWVTFKRDGKCDDNTWRVMESSPVHASFVDHRLVVDLDTNADNGILTGGTYLTTVSFGFSKIGPITGRSAKSYSYRERETDKIINEAKKYDKGSFEFPTLNLEYLHSTLTKLMWREWLEEGNRVPAIAIVYSRK